MFISPSTEGSDDHQNWKVTPPLARQVVPRSLAQNSMPPLPYSFTETPLKFCTV